jgi:SAM-dependent methyltransferase
MAGLPDIEGMRDYWDDRAEQDAAWYVDTSIDYEQRDMDRFWSTGRIMLAEALNRSVPAPTARGQAVEIGCGLGRVCGALSEHFDRVIGLDISARMVGQARDLVRNDRIEFVVGDGVSWQPIPAASTDLVLSFTVFQHIPSVAVIESYLAEAARILRPGGVMVFQWSSQPGAWWWPARRWVLANLQRAGWGDPFGGSALELSGSRIPVNRMRRALADNGLELEAVRAEGTLFTWAWARKP